MRLLKSAASAIVLFSLFASFAEAKPYSIPADKPLANLDVADDWKADNSDPAGVVAISPDNAVLIAAGTAPTNETDNVVSSLVQLLTRNGFKADDATKKTSTSEADLDGNHAKISTLTYTGKDNDGTGSVNITTYQFDKRPDQIFAFSVLLNAKATQQDNDAATAINKSVRFTP